MDDRIHFIITGGTIDSYYDPIKETTIPNVHSTIPLFIPILKLYETCSFTELFMKDSRAVTDNDRQKVIKEVLKCNAKRIIISHGSYTVADTAKYLRKYLRKHKSVIIFVCAMIPLTGIVPTDAGFNLGYAVAKSQDLKDGIYVCMNGRVFTPEEIYKILSEGRFGSVYTK